MALGMSERDAYLTRYGSGPALLRLAWSEVPADARQWRPGTDKWSAHEVVVHCADSETYGATRIRLVLAEKEPLIIGYDEAQWAQSFDYHGQDVELAFRTIEAVRSNTVTMLRRLPEKAWNRVGRHSHSGAYSDADWLRIYAEHLEIHARQIRRNLQAWKDRFG